MNYLNYYHCPNCGSRWEDTADCTCNDRCPGCNTEIEPYSSADISPLEEQSIKNLIKGLIEKIKKDVAKDNESDTKTFNEILSALKSAGDCSHLHNNATKTASYLLKIAGIETSEDDEDE